MHNWSKLKFLLGKEFLAESLQGIVKHSLTKYHWSNSDYYGRFVIKVHDKEVFVANYDNFYKEFNKLFPDYKKKNNIGLYRLDKMIDDELSVELANKGYISIPMMLNSIDIYLNQDIKLSIYSPIPTIRLLTILDRRIGKRTLTQLFNQIDSQPEWLKYFYILRINNELIYK